MLFQSVLEKLKQEEVSSYIVVARVDVGGHESPVTVSFTSNPCPRESHSVALHAVCMIYDFWIIHSKKMM